MYEHNVVKITPDMMHSFYNNVDVDVDVKIKYNENYKINQKFIKYNEIITLNNIVLFVLILIVILCTMFFK